MIKPKKQQLEEIIEAHKKFKAEMIEGINLKHHSVILDENDCKLGTFLNHFSSDIPTELSTIRLVHRRFHYYASIVAFLIEADSWDDGKAMDLMLAASENLENMIEIWIENFS